MLLREMLIDYQNPRNFMAIKKMYFGVHLASSIVDPNIVKAVKINCLDFYIESVEYILTRLPLKNSKFENLYFMYPAIVKSKYIGSITPAANDFMQLVAMIVVMISK